MGNDIEIHDQIKNAQPSSENRKCFIKRPKKVTKNRILSITGHYQDVTFNYLLIGGSC